MQDVAAEYFQDIDSQVIGNNNVGFPASTLHTNVDQNMDESLQIDYWRYSNFP